MLKIPQALKDFTDTSVRGVVEVLYPANDLGAPDWRDAACVERMRRYLDTLPPRQAWQLTLLFSIVELAAPLLVPAPRRFSRLSPERRLAAMQRWRVSRSPARRMLIDALKATSNMVYMSHPAVMRHLGIYKACAGPPDGLDVERRLDTFAAPT